MLELVRTVRARPGVDIEVVKTLMIFAGFGLLLSLLLVVGGIDLSLLSSF